MIRLKYGKPIATFIILIVGIMAALIFNIKASWFASKYNAKEEIDNPIFSTRPTDILMYGVHFRIPWNYMYGAGTKLSPVQGEVSGFNIRALMPDFLPMTLETADAITDPLPDSLATRIYIRRSCKIYTQDCDPATFMKIKFNAHGKGLSVKSKVREDRVHRLPNVADLPLAPGFHYFKVNDSHSRGKYLYRNYTQVLDVNEPYREFIVCSTPGAVRSPACAHYFKWQDKFILVSHFKIKQLAKYQDIRDKALEFLDSWIVQK